MKKFVVKLSEEYCWNQLFVQNVYGNGVNKSKTIVFEIKLMESISLIYQIWTYSSI